MPELPEVETIMRGLETIMPGRQILKVRQRRPDLRRPFPTNLAQRLEGMHTQRLWRRAKYILAGMNDGTVLLLHLGMSGRLTTDPIGTEVPDSLHDHLVLHLEGGVTVRFNDPRRFGLVDLLTLKTFATHPLIRNLGHEPLDPAFNGQRLANCLAGRRTPVKAALMDQQLVVGLGNIYACEALFRAGINPRREAGLVAGKTADRLVAAIRSVLTDAINSGGSSLRDFRQLSGEPGYFQHGFAVYGRAGKACPGCDCDASSSGRILRTLIAGRSTFHCPHRQP